MHCHLLPPSELCYGPDQAVHCDILELHPYLPLCWLQSKESAVGCNLLRIMTLNVIYLKFSHAHPVYMKVN